jgi:uncharacterized membrane protein YcaP (DUF421 family)
MGGFLRLTQVLEYASYQRHSLVSALTVLISTSQVDGIYPLLFYIFVSIHLFLVNTTATNTFDITMSGTSTSNSNGTILIFGPNVIQLQDFYVKAGILHPLIVGSIAVIVLFGYLRLGSNRSITPITSFDWLVNVALGSTLAGIINGNSLVRGLLALATLLAFQHFASIVTSRSRRFSWLFQAEPVVVAFRGTMLFKVMKKHRISPIDVNAALRALRILNICQVEVAIIEPNGTISVVTKKELEEAKVEPSVLMCVQAYRLLCENDSKAGQRHDSAKDDSEERKLGNQDSTSRDRNSIVLEVC